MDRTRSIDSTYGIKSVSGIKMEENLKSLGNFREIEFTTSNFVTPKSVLYEQKNGDKMVMRRWDLIESHDSVAILLYHINWDAMLIVRQFRPAVYASKARKLKSNNGTNGLDFSFGFTYELCAGIVDKEMSLREVVQEEILEECGYRVPLEDISEITSFISAIGTAGTTQTLFFAKLDESMRVSDAGGHEGENIELLSLPVSSLDKFVVDSSLNKSTGLMFSFLWFLKEFKR